MEENIVIEVEIDSGKSGETLGQLESKLDSLKESIRGVDTGSDAFKSLSSEIANTESKVKNLELSMEGLDMDQKSSEFGSFAAGLADTATGALALSSAMGLTNESSEEMIEKLVSGMAVAQTFRGGLDGIVSAQKLLRTSTIANTVATNGGTVAMRAFNAVTKANPLGILITGLTAAVGAFALFNNSLEDSNELTDELIGKIADESTEFVGLVNALKSTNENSTTRLRLIKEINEEYGTSLTNLQDEEKFQNQLNLAVDEYIKKQKEKLLFQAQEEKITGLIKEQIELEEFLKTARESDDWDPESFNKFYSEQRDRINEIDSELKELGESFLDVNEKSVPRPDAGEAWGNYNDIQKEIKETEEKRGKDTIPKVTKETDKLLVKEKERITVLEDYLSLLKLGEADEDTTATNLQERINKLSKWLELKREENALPPPPDFDPEEGREAPELATLNEFELPGENESPIEAAKREYAELLSLQKANLDNKYINEQQYADKKRELDNWLASEEKKIRAASTNFAIQQASGLFTALGQFAEEGSGASKTLGMASIVADTASSLMKAVPVALEAAKATGPGAPFVFAGTLAGIVTTVMGAAANAKKVLSSAPGPSASGGGGGINVSRTNIQNPQSTPNINLFGSSNSGSSNVDPNNNPNGTGMSQVPTVKAVVSWSDIEAVQNDDLSLMSEMQL